MKQDVTWHHANNWVKRCAHHYPGILVTAMIGPYRLSCIVVNGKQRIRSWYVYV